jgi:hypothetical protein
VLRDQLQAFWNAAPTVRARFPRGLVQFEEAVELMDPEWLEALVPVAVIGNEEADEAEGWMGQGEMPGEMPGMPRWDEEGPALAAPEAVAQEEEGEQEEVDEEEGEEVAVRHFPCLLS